MQAFFTRHDLCVLFRGEWPRQAAHGLVRCFRGGIAMTGRNVIGVLTALTLGAAAITMPTTAEAGKGPVQNVTYVGDLHGARATAKVSYEPLREYTLMGGEIRSVGGSLYTFTADLVGNSGYATVVDHRDNVRFLARIDLTREGFSLTSNPFGPGMPTTYYFRKQ
jgi:hypothetical protein